MIIRIILLNRRDKIRLSTKKVYKYILNEGTYGNAKSDIIPIELKSMLYLFNLYLYEAKSRPV